MKIKVNCNVYPRMGPKRALKKALEKNWRSQLQLPC
jgi:hypothetical protein